MRWELGVLASIRALCIRRFFNSVKCLKLTQFLRKMCYAPAHDGARAVTMAALYPFAPQNMCFNSSPQMRAMDQGSRHFSRGLFAGKFIGTYGPTKFPEEGNFVQKFIWHAWTFMFASCVFWISLFDWPVRKYFKDKNLTVLESSYHPTLLTIKS